MAGGTSNGDSSLEDDEVTLIDEAGAERRFRLHDVFDLDGSAYYLVEGVDDPEEVLLLRETGDGLESVDTDEMERILTRLDQESENGTDAKDAKDAKEEDES